MGAVLVLLFVLYAAYGKQFRHRTASIGTTERRVDAVVDLGDDGAKDCTHPELQRGSLLPAAEVRPKSTACVVVGSVDNLRRLKWFFIGHGAGDGTVRVPRPELIGLRDVRLVNGAVVPIGPQVGVRCTADPNARFESFVASGKATASFLDRAGVLVAIDCDAP